MTFAATAFGQIQSNTNLLGGIGTQLSNQAMPFTIPETGELLGLLIKGQIFPAEFDLLTRRNGHHFGNTDGQLRYGREFRGMFYKRADYHPRGSQAMNQVIPNALYYPNIGEMQQMLNRGKLDVELYNHMMRWSTDGNPMWRDWYEELRHEYPGPSDLIRFAVREGFDSATIEEYDYHKEIPTQLRPFMAYQGLGRPINMDMPAGATDVNGLPVAGKVTWSDMYWFAHWELPSIGQGYDMLHRLYYESPFGPSPDVRDDTRFNAENMAKLLKVQDIPQYWRDRLIAISFHPINVTDAKAGFQIGTMSDSDYYHSLRRQGYNDEDAQKLLKLATKQKQRNLGIEPGKVSQDWICQHYKTGMITDSDAINFLRRTGFTIGDAISLLQKCKLELKSEANKTVLAAYKRMYMAGVYNTAQISALMKGRGFNSEVVDLLADTWAIVKSSKYKLLSAKQLLESYSNGVISQIELVARLQNLDYAPGQIPIIVANANNKMVAKQTKAMQAQAKAKAMAAKQLAKDNMKKVKDATKAAAALQARKQKIVDQRIKAMVKASTDKHILDWYTQDLFKLSDVYYRLYIKGYNRQDAARWVQEKIKGLEKKEYDNAALQAQKEYTAEGNRPLSIVDSD